MIKQKGLKAIVISLLIILSASCFSLLFSSAYKTFTKEEISAASEWNFSTQGSLTGQNEHMAFYSSNSNFIIEDFKGLQNFATSVNSYSYDFSGKTVKLKANIDCENSGVGIGNNTTCFQGTFDGRGFTISNYSPNSYVVSTTISDSYKAYGLFTKLTSASKILKLRILNSGRSISGGDYKYVGGIVGYSEGSTIQRCIVENFTISTTDKTERIYVSGIFAAGYATVENCYVENLVINNGCGASAGIGCAANYRNVSWGTVTFAWSTLDSTLSSCIVREDSLTYDFISPTAYETPSGAYDYNHSITSCYSTNPQNALNAYWYYWSGYNGGWPYLDCFVDKTTFVFSQSLGGNSTNRYVPVGYEEILAEEINNNTNQAIDVAGDSVTAEDENGYIFSKWERDTSAEGYKFNATYIPETYTLKFKSTKILGDSISYSPDIETVTVQYGQTINVSEYEDNNPFSGYYERTAAYTINGTEITYDLGDKVQIASWGTLNGVEIIDGLTIPDLDNGVTYEITPTIKYILCTVKFNVNNKISQFKVNNEVSTTYEHQVIRGTNLTETISADKTQDIYEFTNSRGNKVTVTYTANELYNIDYLYYDFETEKPFTSLKVNVSTYSITPNTYQTKIRVHFGTTQIVVNGTVKNISADLSAVAGANEGEFLIDYKTSPGNSYTLSSPTSTPENETEYKATYTLTSCTNQKYTVSYTIPLEYKITSTLIDEQQEVITINPVIDPVYVVLKFKPIEAEKTTDETMIKAEGTIGVYSDYDYYVVQMDSDSSINASLSEYKDTLILTFTKDGNEVTVTYNLDTVNRIYYLMDSYYKQQPEEGTPRVIEIQIELKTYDIEFG